MYMENEMFNVKYIPYLKNERKIKRTSYKIWERIKKHKFIITIMSVILIATSTNVLLMFNFIKLLETLR